MPETPLSVFVPHGLTLAVDADHLRVRVTRGKCRRIMVYGLEQLHGVRYGQGQLVLDLDDGTSDISELGQAAVEVCERVTGLR